MSASSSDSSRYEACSERVSCKGQRNGWSMSLAKRGNFLKGKWRATEALEDIEFMGAKTKSRAFSRRSQVTIYIQPYGNVHISRLIIVHPTTTKAFLRLLQQYSFFAWPPCLRNLNDPVKHSEGATARGVHALLRDYLVKSTHTGLGYFLGHNQLV
jgi:hypothetical protein